MLADFTVSTDTTRVVIITYSSVDRVTRQVDQISSPGEEHHKCRLLETEIPRISYDSGGTYTLGALRQALEVLQVRDGGQSGHFWKTNLKKIWPLKKSGRQFVNRNGIKTEKIGQKRRLYLSVWLFFLLC